MERIKGRELPGFDEAAAWLRAHRPIDYIPGLMHGDYQFANVMFKHGAPARLAAIVDWEMGTVGDPKLDLGWVMNSWPEDTSADEDRAGGYVDMHGMPSRSEMLAHYSSISGRQVDDIDYYNVLAKWKLAVVLEQGFQRAGNDEKLLAFGPIVLELMQAAADLAESTDYDVPASPRAEVRAALCRTYGGPEVIELAEVPSPPLGPGQVRVRITIGAVNFPDVLVVANTYQVSVPTPFILGSEYAGTVVELGEGADGLALGDRVFGSTIVGAFAEEIVVAPGALMRIPDGVDDRTAAAFGVAYRTAYHVLRSVAALQPGEELVVLGAGGGVGSAAVQLGVLLGATVTAVASTPEKLEAAAGTRRGAPHRPLLRRPAPGPARRVAERRRRRDRPGGRRPGRARTPLAALRRPLRHRGLRLGVDPAHTA